jgi:hypothetical protein
VVCAHINIGIKYAKQSETNEDEVGELMYTCSVQTMPNMKLKQIWNNIYKNKINILQHGMQATLI